MNKCIMKSEELNNEIKNVFGNGYELIKVTRLIGGAQKGTFKVQCNKNFTFILYIWSECYDEFSEYNDKADEFTSNSALLFLKNGKMLEENNISIQKVYYSDISKVKYPYEFAFVQYIDTLDLEAIVGNGDYRYSRIFENIQDNLLRIHNITSTRAGDLNKLQDDDFRCEEYIYNQLMINLNYLLQNYKPVMKFEKEIIIMVDKIYRKIMPRKKYSFIHYELGPNHVLADKENNIYLIDIDGMKFFDLEFEHSFLKFRFGEFYKYFKREDLDEDRMDFYKLHHHIGALSGAYKLIQNNYEDMDDVNEMIRYNYNEILKYLER